MNCVPILNSYLANLRQTKLITFRTAHNKTVKLIATGGSGHRLQSGSAQVLPVAERAYERENHSEFALFRIFIPLKHRLLTFQYQPVYSPLLKHLHKQEGGRGVINPYFAEVCTSLSLQIPLFQKGERNLIHSFFLLKFPDIILQIGKTIGPISSAEELLSAVFESVSNATANMESSLTTPGQCFTWYLCKMPDLQRCHFGP